MLHSLISSRDRKQPTQVRSSSRQQFRTHGDWAERSISLMNVAYRGTMYRSLSWFAFFGLFPLSGGAADIYAHFPDTIHANERYVIYSHGLIVEGDNPKPISPKFGQYDFPGIKLALFSGGGFNLIAYQRPKNTEVAA